jgi:GT2 family glycosyltransferase
LTVGGPSRSAATVSPVATFAIPCRNAGPYLRPLLHSLLAQTRQDFALLLCDDASDDGSADAAREVAGERIQVRRNEPALGIGGNWNRCVQQVTTPFVCLAHQDDVYEALQARPDAGVAHCRAIAIDHAGAVMPSPAERFKEHFWRCSPGTDRAAHYRRLWRGNLVCCPTQLFRTAALQAAGPFRSDLRFALDWEYSFRLLRAGFGIVDVPAALVRYRRHAGAATHAANADRTRFGEELAVLREAVALGAAAGLLPPGLPVSPALRNNLLHEALADLSAGRREGVRGKLQFVREHAPELWRDPYVRAFRGAVRLGPPGRWLLTLGRELAVRFGLGGASS